MSLALVLGGGAARGAYHLGFLHFCDENHIKIEAFSGASIGAIVGASYASGVSAKEQFRILSSKEARKNLKFNYFKDTGLIRIDTDTKITDELFPIKKLEDMPKPVWVNAYDLKEKKLHYFNSGDTVPLCLGSSALRVLFPPIKYQNMSLIDGGYFDNLPLKPLENQGYDILTIDLFAHKKLTKPSIGASMYSKIKRHFLVQLYQNRRYTLEHTDYYLGSEYITDFYLFTFHQMQDCFDLGYKEAVEFFKNSKF